MGNVSLSLSLTLEFGSFAFLCLRFSAFGREIYCVFSRLCDVYFFHVSFLFFFSVAYNLVFFVYYILSLYTRLLVVIFPFSKCYFALL